MMMYLNNKWKLDGTKENSDYIFFYKRLEGTDDPEFYDAIEDYEMLKAEGKEKFVNWRGEVFEFDKIELSRVVVSKDDICTGQVTMVMSCHKIVKVS